MYLLSIIDKVRPSDWACLMRPAATRAAAPPPMVMMSERMKLQLFENDCWSFIVEAETAAARTRRDCTARVAESLVKVLAGGREGGEARLLTTLRE
jgi:hypothetical protein